MKKTCRYIALALAMLCILVNLSLFAFAADPGFLTINNQEIDKISITGENDGITIANNSYKIKAVDASSTSCNTTTYTGQTRTMTFKNNYNGWIKITYSIDTNGILSAGSGCTVADGVITMQSGGTFTIAVTSSTQSGASSSKNTTSEFKPTSIVYEELTPPISFIAPSEHGTFTVTDKGGTEVSIGNTAESSFYTLTAKPDTNYQVFRWVFTDESGAVSYFGEKTNSLTYTASEAGKITCEFMRSGSAIYSVNDEKYAYLDKAIADTNNSGSVIVVDSGSVYGLDGNTNITIPNGVKLVLPYAEGQTTVQGTSLTSNKYYAYGNYGQGTSFSAQPGALTSSKYLELTVPQGTTILNNGIIAVGGTLQGNAAMSGAHSNLKVDGTLELHSNTSVLSAIGYVYGSGSVTANGSGAKILQPLSLLRNGSWGWSVANVGHSMNSRYGMQTYPADGYDGGNPSPRYATQNIQCRLEMMAGDTMYGYADQHCESHYMGVVTLVGTNKSSSLIALHENASLISTYDGNKKSSLYGNVGKQTLEISGGATQGTFSLSMNGWTLDLTKWPFPVPYNYDIVLKNGTYNLQFDLSLLPGAGLKVDSDAVLNIPEGVYLTVFTGANDHSIGGVHQSSAEFSKTTYNNGTPKSPNYPANSTWTKASALNGVTNGSNMANLIVDGTLDVKSGAHLGGVVQTTTGEGKVVMNGNAGRFTRQLGLTGKVADTDLITQYWYMSGATIYEFYPQYFDANGVLQTMETGKTYQAASTDTNNIDTFSFDLYTNSSNVSEKTSHTETINATAVGEWVAVNTVTFDANGGEGTMEAIKRPSGDSVTLVTSSFTRQCHAFMGWNTAADGSGTAYADGDEITVTGDMTLYAQWEAGHTWSETAYTWSDDDSSCTASRECSVCHLSEEETKDADIEITPATCTGNGNSNYTVTFDAGWAAEQTKNKEIAATGCNYGEGEVTTEPTCTIEGEKTLTCSACGLTETEVIPALGHDIVIDEAVAATCEGTGLTAGQHCSRCEDATVAQEVIEALGHTELVVEGKDATCGESGLTDGKTCSVCGKVIEAQTEIPALDHDEVSHEAKTPTCTEKGWDAYVTCTRCDYTTYVEKAALNHKYEVTASKDATCTEDGFVTYTCGNDNSHTYTETMNKTGHAMVHREAVAAGCETEGTLEHWYCSNCQKNFADEAGAVELNSVVVGATGHTEAEMPAVDATCEATGLTAGVKCSVCQKVLTAQTEVPALGHDYELTASKDASCKEEGFKTYTCKNNGTHTYTETLDKLSHTEETVAGKDATCTETGLTEGKKCTVCGVTTVAQNEIPVKEHTEATREENRVEATCGEDGSYDLVTYCMTCSNVIKTETKVIEATGNHSYEESVTKEATCTEPGTKTFTCVCGETYTEEIKALGHDEVSHDAKTPTCTEKGWDAYVTCTRCGYTTYVEKAELGHTEGEVVVENNVDPGCETEGSYDNVVYCTVCGEELSRENVTVDALGHKEETVEGKDATCTETGLTEGKKCTVCGVTTEEQEEISAKGHTEEKLEGKDATCTETGLTEGKKCTVCGVTTVAQSEIPVKEHTEATREENRVEATCGEDGSYDLVTYCSICSNVIKTETKVIEATGNHSYEESVTKEATCTEPGTKTFTCVCGETYTEEIKALGHDAVSHDAKEPTCTEKGWDAYVTCSRCEYTTYVEKAATGHSLSDWIIDQEADCETDGSKHKECASCDYEETEVIKATGHTEGEPVEENRVEADADHAGSYDNVVYCTVCGAELSRETIEIPALGHTYGEVVESKDATCTDAGYKIYSCSCGETHTEEIEALGHTEVVDAAVEPTCTTSGKTAGKHCSVCGEVLEAQEVVDALGHSYGEGVVTKEATDTEDGEMTYTCGTCGTTKTEVILATGGEGSEEPEDYFVPSIGSGETFNKPADVNSTTIIYIDDIEVSVFAPKSGWKIGENTFTVENKDDIACVVMVQDKNGVYRKLDETTVEGKHSFTADNLSINDKIVVVRKGDANNDGRINNKDIILVKRLANKTTWTDYDLFVMNVVGNDTSIGNKEIIMIKRAANGTALSW